MDGWHNVLGWTVLSIGSFNSLLRIVGETAYRWMHALHDILPMVIGIDRHLVQYFFLWLAMAIVY